MAGYCVAFFVFLKFLMPFDADKVIWDKVCLKLHHGSVFFGAALVNEVAFAFHVEESRFSCDHWKDKHLRATATSQMRPLLTVVRIRNYRTLASLPSTLDARTIWSAIKEFKAL